MIDRKEFLDELFSKIEETYGMNLQQNKKGIKFASEAIRKNLTVQEAFDLLGQEFNLIEIE